MEVPPWVHAHNQQLRLKLYPQGVRYAWACLMGRWVHCYQDLWAFLGDTPTEDGGKKAVLSGSGGSDRMPNPGHSDPPQPAPGSSPRLRGRVGSKICITHDSRTWAENCSLDVSQQPGQSKGKKHGERKASAPRLMGPLGHSNGAGHPELTEGGL